MKYQFAAPFYWVSKPNRQVAIQDSMLSPYAIHVEYNDPQ